ncbi:MAG: DUF359 domain-containing protein [Euryarchaeota archaeon]|nr:DUF359 domain-containing protein [Euryarchaeota archaeon]MDE1837030.1 DUF359 domain-containing protein [Euryarchaeota archaeon]MDE1879880.1 DUF359 domain-containing protein [Euryarchaeota archaeon]MDE2045688.1 DUF359 domain-containing protein [Thermoplasmata archaeon]
MDLYLRPEQRALLARPLGPVLPTDEARARLARTTNFVACGDVVSVNAMKWGFTPFAAVVDGHTLRETTTEITELGPLGAKREIWTKNPAGQVTEELQRAVRELVSGGGGLLVVEGEEDLAVLPLVRELPLGSTVIYGQPGAGVCFLAVDDATKERVRTILEGMEARPTGHGHQGHL